MQKYLFFILLSCLHFTAKGQTVLDDLDLSWLPHTTTAKALYFWFDDDNSSIKTISQLKGEQTLDVSDLIDGLHALHYQVIDENNKVSYVGSSLFMKVECDYDDPTAKQLHFWFDYDSTIVKSNLATDSNQTLDASQLLDGLHVIHCQIAGNNGTLGAPYSSLFLKMNTKSIQNASFIRYWFDDNYSGYRQGVLSSVMMVDASSLLEGTHSLHYQLVADDGQVFSVNSAHFERRMYDIYVSDWIEYAEKNISNDSLFALKPSLKLHYTTDDMNIRGHLTVKESTTLSLNKYIQTANWGNKNDDNKYAKAGTDYYHPTTLLNNGFVRADSVIVKQSLYRDQWHFISLPFNVNVSEIEASNGTYWALRQYDGEARATGQMNETWQNLRQGDQMEAGRGYIIQLTKEGTEKTSELTFKAQNDPKKINIFTTEDVDIPLEEHQSEFAHNRSWNLIGNPYPCFFDTRCIEQNGTIIVWNGNGYTAYSLDDDNYILMPFEAFFIQKPLNNNTLMFNKEGRQHTHEILPRAASRNQAKSLQNRHILNFAISDGVDTDRSRVVINEQASIGYETDKDAPKFMETRPNMPQLFSVESGVQYSINERPMGDGQIVFSLYAPVDGEYHFSVDGDATNMMVLDTETGASWALGDGDYVFTATEGMHNTRLVVSLTGKTTDIAQINAYDDGEVRVADGLLSFRFIRNKHIKVFGVDGRVLYNDITGMASIKVASGIYVVDLDGKTTKIMVK